MHEPRIVQCLSRRLATKGNVAPRRLSVRDRCCCTEFLRNSANPGRQRWICRHGRGQSPSGDTQNRVFFGREAGSRPRAGAIPGPAPASGARPGALQRQRDHRRPLVPGDRGRGDRRRSLHGRRQQRPDAVDRRPVDPADRPEGPDRHSGADGQPPARRRRRPGRRPVSRALAAPISRRPLRLASRRRSPATSSCRTATGTRRSSRSNVCRCETTSTASRPPIPVILVRGGHEYILNSAALARSNITEKTAEPAGGRITRYADGRLNGELVDSARALVTSAAGAASHAQRSARRPASPTTRSSTQRA